MTNVINLSEYRLKRFAQEIEGYTSIGSASESLVNKMEASRRHRMDSACLHADGLRERSPIRFE